ncbi:MAG: hypothetical protein UW68_C0012G0021 [Candidatus Collierbacteria bacterium GW2011_GWB1_44_6]|uniref:Uncharacterized protein n=2 Tax=Candidatus Collieribacteriota TaxID=1752725 RepID=A0A0G1JPR9_9BACT|nr:MAG: hypothetical protein UV68_C0027G0007 [Candidatus Collierbacteria bacterium GW2011_GWC2_43_12]KKT73328.1 MAG: hypothetical protein UW68_C0012G0021 [Candidatus Collierbacteria bacterium GW2011_GWB1_44_6]
MKKKAQDATTMAIESLAWFLGSLALVNSMVTA